MSGRYYHSDSSSRDSSARSGRYRYHYTGTSLGRPRYSLETSDQRAERKAFEKLKRRLNRLARNLSKCEVLYTDIGQLFWTFPILARDTMINGSTTRMFVTRRDHREPTSIKDMMGAHTLIDECKTAIRRNDYDTAKHKFHYAYMYVEDCKGELLETRTYLQQKQAQYAARFPVNAFVDEGLPHHYAGLGHGRKYDEIVKWVGQLPDVRRGIELGALTRQQAFEEMYFQPGDEDRIVEVEEADFEEVKSKADDQRRMPPGAWAFR